MANKTHKFLDEIAEMRKLFVKEKPAIKTEFDELSFRLWIEAQNNARFEEGLELNKQIFELNKQIKKLNEETSKSISAFAKAIEKFADNVGSSK